MMMRVLRRFDKLTADELSTDGSVCSLQAPAPQSGIVQFDGLTTDRRTPKLGS
jgi:hypothetical protein